MHIFHIDLINNTKYKNTFKVCIVYNYLDCTVCAMGIANIEEEYKKNKELHREDVQSLKEWAQKQPHLPPISEVQFAIFLHSCCWSVERTKTTIEKFVTYRRAWPDFFSNQNTKDPKVRSAMDVTLFTFLPKKTPEGCKVVYFSLVNTDLSRYSTKDVIKIFDMMIMLEIMQTGTFDGWVFVGDLTSYSAGHVLKTQITDTRRVLLYLQEALPVRLKGLHYITQSTICDLLVPLIRPFINKEVSPYVHFHNSYDSLVKFVPQELLPEDLGGKAPSIKELHDGMIRSFVENADFFVEGEAFVSNEALRDRRPSYMDRDLGIGFNGSFKKLNFD